MFSTHRKGSSMGFLDDIQALTDRGMASVERTGRSAKLKMQQADLLKQRKELAAQLGASLYDATKNNAEFKAGREALYDGIASLDQQRAAVEAELAQIEQEAQAQAQAVAVYTCPNCGSAVRAGDMFCAGCGTPAAQIIPQQPVAPAASGATCIHCGAPINPGDLFCMTCGGKQDAASAATAAPTPAAPAEPAAQSAPAAQPATPAEGAPSDTAEA